MLFVISLVVKFLFEDDHSWATITAWIFGGGAISLPIFGFKDLKKIWEHPLSTQLQTYLKLPDYGKHLGLVPVLKRHIKTLCSLLLGKEQKLVVFVDDLDRCNVDHISKVLDAIRLVMTIPNVIVMIGIDHNIAFKAVGKHYKLLAEKEDGSKRTSAEVARDYLGKIIQLPLRLMPASDAGLEEYVEKKLFDEKNLVDDKETVKATEDENIEETTPEKVISKTSDTQEVPTGDDSLPGTSDVTDSDIEEVDEEKISEAIKDTIGEREAFCDLAKKYEFKNPRQLLRLHNSFRFLKGFGSGQGEDGNNTLDMLKMLFWQEFLHNWPMKVRYGCMATLSDDKDIQVGEVIPEVRGVLKKVKKGDISKLFKEEPTRYEELAKFVRVVVLPHNEEGVLDSTDAIKDWIAEEERKRKDKEAT